MAPLRITLVAAAALGLCALGWTHLAAAPAGTSCDRLTQLTIPDATISAAGAVPAGAFNVPGMRAPTILPAFCRVQGAAKPTADSDIRFEVWIPQDNWNGKFQEVGVGGYDGSISYDAMATALKRGYAVEGNDVGHQGGDLKFGLGHPEKLVDWAYRAMHVSAQIGKLVVRNMTGRWPDYSYFVGCSTGGHQGLSEAQRFPDDFDGIVAGDPAYDRLHETATYLYSWEATHDAAGVSLLSPAKLALISRSATAACGDQDGVIEEPRKCKFQPATLLCASTETDDCLTRSQIEAVNKVYAGLHNPRTGEQIIPGYAPGSEGFGNGGLQGWGGYFTQPKLPMRWEIYSYFVLHNPNWDYHNFDFDKDVAYTDQQIGFMSAVDPDLSKFRARGGKLLMYTGWIDPIAPPEDIANYYEAVGKKMGGFDKIKDFYRFFMVPGMGHCTGGPGTYDFDMVTELENWVEHGKAPDRVIAAHPQDSRPARTRPLCPYPAIAQWDGKGNRSEAGSFVCKAATL